MSGIYPWGGAPLRVWIDGTDVVGGSTVSVANFPQSQPVTGTFWQATQPISGSISVSNFPSGLTDTQLRATAVPVSGTFWPATQPVSAISLPLPTGAATDASVVALTKPSTLCVTATAAVNTALTLTLPAVAAQFHYITNIQISKLYSVIGVASGSGVVITTTNIPGSLAFTTEQLASAAGTVAKVVDMNFGGNPLKSSVVNTATTFVCPQQLQTIWRITVTYYAGT